MPPVRYRVAGAWMLAALLAAAHVARAADTQTIVMVRHGEKPAAGLGQLACQGLNRALALPQVIHDRFGKPDAIFAPSPAQSKRDHGIVYDYVRPLATIEPTAIRFGLPVNTQFGYAQTQALVTQLEKPRYRTSLVVVAWEHVELVKIARALLAGNGGDASTVPAWHYDDFDGIYVVRIERDAKGAHAVFSRQIEGLDGQPEQCPGPP
ncbi:MAG: hypothetical protein JSS44_01930 [Proteobacteria bacterium]|nr:hypothetical protein [Pseudomonadota bacterium]MBS0462800.1 hypothetical protein [Pseudomonadota bacterium]MBS0464932.1 hypothetical protein [Pseudomonadota bacterium]